MAGSRSSPRGSDRTGSDQAMAAIGGRQSFFPPGLVYPEKCRPGSTVPGASGEARGTGSEE